jgi:hypothetical protein
MMPPVTTTRQSEHGKSEEEKREKTKKRVHERPSWSLSARNSGAIGGAKRPSTKRDGLGFFNGPLPLVEGLFAL